MAVHDFSHPCSILSLDEAPVWHLIIDETGSSFNAKARELTDSDSAVGKVVGLLHHEILQLPKLQQRFHATQSDVATVHSVLENLLKAKVGIIGCSVKVEEIEGYGWINSIRLLTRWALALLPASGEPVKVKVFVEQRAPYIDGTDMRAFSETLQNDMQKLSPKRLGRLKLEFNIIPKSGHPHNGYVDSLAYLWGSPKPENRAFLKQLKLINSCFINDDTLFVERLFLLIQHQHKLIPEDWYQLASLPVFDYSGTLLDECLELLGEECKNDGERWTQFLDYVCERQLAKNYLPSDLLHASNWLARFQPNQLTPIVNLRLLNIRLSTNNHLGHVAKDVAQSATQLAERLFDEDAQLCCETTLRVIVMHCNNCDFSAAKELAEKWLQHPLALIGKKNYGKLLSSLGQCEAFMGNASANDYFKQAIDVFQTLAAQNESTAEIKQTSHYLALHNMDSPNVSESLVLQQFLKLFNLKNELELRRTAADYAHGKLTDRFAHFLLLRACIKCPIEFSQVSKAYLSQQEFWTYGDSHPWQLIHLYRALLLWQTTKTHQQLLAKDYINKAITVSEHKSNGPILLKMASVFQSVRERMNNPAKPLPSSSDLLSEISQKLPFAFH